MFSPTRSVYFSCDKKEIHYQLSRSKHKPTCILARYPTQLLQYLCVISVLWVHSSIPHSQSKGTTWHCRLQFFSMLVSLCDNTISWAQLSILSSVACKANNPSCFAFFLFPWILPVERCSNSSLGRSIHHCPSHSSLAISTWDALQKESLPKKAVLREGKSIHHVIGALIPVKRKEGDSQKLPIRSIPSSITKEEREGRSLDHLSSSDSLSISREE